MNYPIINLPYHHTQLGDLSRKEARKYFDFLMDVKEKRITILENFINSDSKLSPWQADYSPESLRVLEPWLFKNTKFIPTTKEQRKNYKESLPDIFKTVSFPTPNEIPNLESYSRAIDVYLYFAEVLIKNNPTLKWELCFKSKKYIYYQKPVVSKFKLNDFAPIDLANTHLYRIKDGEHYSIEDAYYRYVDRIK